MISHYAFSWELIFSNRLYTPDVSIRREVRSKKTIPRFLMLGEKRAKKYGKCMGKKIGNLMSNNSRKNSSFSICMN